MTNASSGFDAVDYVAVVDFDHGVTGMPPQAGGDEEHYMFEDDYGTDFGTYEQWHGNEVAYTDYSHGVYDMEIYPHGGQKIVFAFINTCFSADARRLGEGDMYHNGNMVGMPYAWTHRYLTAYGTSNPPAGYMSSDGYFLPDMSSQVYIGFEQGSAALAQKIPLQENGPQYSNWVTSFFYYALVCDLSVNDALDSASTDQWGSCTSFANCPLSLGFECSWPYYYNGAWHDNNGPYGTGNRMAVYGNGRIHLQNYHPIEYVSPPLLSGSSEGIVDQPLYFQASSTDTLGHSVRYTFQWDDDPVATTTDYYPSGQFSQPVSHTWHSAGGDHSVTVIAESDQGVTSSSFAVITINNPQPTYHQLTVYACDGWSWYLTPEVYLNGNPIGTAPLTVNVSEGWYEIAVDSAYSQQFTCWEEFNYFCSSDGYNYYSGSSIPIYHDMTSVAYFKPPQ